MLEILGSRYSEPDSATFPEMLADGLANQGLLVGPVLRGPLQALAIRWKILDPREVRYILARQEDFVADLNLLRRRHGDGCRNPAY